MTLVQAILEVIFLPMPIGMGLNREFARGGCELFPDLVMYGTLYWFMFDIDIIGGIKKKLTGQ